MEPDAPDLGRMYAAARGRITDLVRDADPCTPVPATPGWDVHDVIAHLRGVVGDALAGNLDGAATDPWTAAQVERARGVSLAQLLEEWSEQAPVVEAVLSSPAGSDVSAVVLDVHTHEADLCGALGVPFVLPDDYAAFMVDVLVPALAGHVVEAGLPPMRVRTAEGDECGAPDATVVFELSRRELHRVAFGRRSPDQIATHLMNCSDPAPYIDALVIFGPRDTPLVD